MPEQELTQAEVSRLGKYRFNNQSTHGHSDYFSFFDVIGIQVQEKLIELLYEPGEDFIFVGLDENPSSKIIYCQIIDCSVKSYLNENRHEYSLVITNKDPRKREETIKCLDEKLY